LGSGFPFTIVLVKVNLIPAKLWILRNILVFFKALFEHYYCENDLTGRSVLLAAAPAPPPLHTPAPTTRLFQLSCLNNKQPF
jgi:hypothetical protein